MNMKKHDIRENYDLYLTKIISENIVFKYIDGSINNNIVYVLQDANPRESSPTYYSAIHTPPPPPPPTHIVGSSGEEPVHPHMPLELYVGAPGGWLSLHTMNSGSAPTALQKEWNRGKKTFF